MIKFALETIWKSLGLLASDVALSLAREGRGLASSIALHHGYKNFCPMSAVRCPLPTACASLCLFHGSCVLDRRKSNLSTDAVVTDKSRDRSTDQPGRVAAFCEPSLLTGHFVLFWKDSVRWLGLWPYVGGLMFTWNSNTTGLPVRVLGFRLHECDDTVASKGYLAVVYLCWSK